MTDGEREEIAWEAYNTAKHLAMDIYDLREDFGDVSIRELIEIGIEVIYAQENERQMI